MKIIPSGVQKFVSSTRTADFVENTIIAVGTETTLKMIGRPSFILLDKDADDKKKKFAAVKEFLYQSICLGLYFTIVGPIKKACYHIVGKLVSGDSNNADMLELCKKLGSNADAAKANYKKTGNLIQRALSTLGINKDQSIKNAKKVWKDAEKSIKVQAKNENEIFDICGFNYETKLGHDTSKIARTKLKEYISKLTPEQQKEYYSSDYFKNIFKQVNPWKGNVIDIINNLLEPKGDFTGTIDNIITNVKARKFGKGVHEFGAIFGSVLTLAMLAPEISHWIIHPIMKALKLEKPESGKH